MEKVWKNHETIDTESVTDTCVVLVVETSRDILSSSNWKGKFSIR